MISGGEQCPPWGSVKLAQEGPQQGKIQLAMCSAVILGSMGVTELPGKAGMKDIKGDSETALEGVNQPWWGCVCRWTGAAVPVGNLSCEQSCAPRHTGRMAEQTDKNIHATVPFDTKMNFSPKLGVYRKLSGHNLVQDF